MILTKCTLSCVCVATDAASALEVVIKAMTVEGGHSQKRSCAKDRQ